MSHQIEILSMKWNVWNVCLVWVPNLYIYLSEPNNSSNEKKIKQYWECKNWENEQIKSGRNEEEWGLQNKYRRENAERIERMQKIDNTWEYTKEWTWLSKNNIANEEREIISHIKIISKRMFYMNSDCLQIFGGERGIRSYCHEQWICYNLPISNQLTRR